MQQSTYSIIGLMSGTSLDGLDIAHCSFCQKDEKWSFKLENSSSIVYTDVFKDKLQKSIDLQAIDLLQLDKEYGRWIGEQVKEFMTERDIKADFVSSHGHTVFHQPYKNLTYQIGSGQELANACGTKVICDFRSLDVSLNGQGAPLVAIGDQLLFSQYDFCLNLGGIANISFQLNEERIAYDISPANMLLNYLTNKIGKAWDQGGGIAQSGNVDSTLIDQLNALPHYKKPYPKSLGYEWFCLEVVPIIEKSDGSISDKLCSSVHHIAQQVINNLKIYPSQANGAVLVSGGGAKNHYLIECFKAYSGGDFKIVVPEPSIIDFKEAIIFAFMGVRRIRNEINCLKSVTGAHRDSSAGIIYEPY